MSASKLDIRAAAEELHPKQNKIRMESRSDFNIPGVPDGDHPGIRIIVSSDGQEFVYEAETRDELLAQLVAKGKGK